MALKGLDIFKITPKTNCKECGNPTCMAFAMKVAQGALPLEKCPYISADVMAQLSEATAPPMKTIKVGAGEQEHTLGGETVLSRHEKTFVSKNLYAAFVCNGRDAEKNAEAFDCLKAIDYDRIGEKMYVEMLEVNDGKNDADSFLALVKEGMEYGRTLILSTKNADTAKAALALCKDAKPILNAADPTNYAEMSAIATEAGVVLGVGADDIDALYDTVAEIEKLGNKNLILTVTTSSIKAAFAQAVEIRRAALKNNDRTFGYPSLVQVNRLTDDHNMQTALATLFTAKYGSIVVMDKMTYSQALPLYGLRQNIFTDPQKPMKVEPGIYPLNGADENSVCVTTVDFALTYFVVSGEIERSGVPVNMLISDAGGYSVLTAWAAGKLSASSLKKFFDEYEIENKIKNRTLILPGKVAVLKGEIEDKLPGWNIVVGTNEAIELVKFLKDYQ